MQTWQRTLMGLIIDDPEMVSTVLVGPPIEHLDARTGSLVEMAVACATDATSISLERVASDAIDAGASEDDVVGVLVACGPLIGASRLVRAAPAVAAGLGYDVDEQLESLDG